MTYDFYKTRTDFDDMPEEEPEPEPETAHCISCNDERQVEEMNFTPKKAGPFCPDCYLSLLDPDEALATEKRLADSEKEIESVRKLSDGDYSTLKKQTDAEIERLTVTIKKLSEPCETCNDLWEVIANKDDVLVKKILHQKAEIERLERSVSDLTRDCIYGHEAEIERLNDHIEFQNKEIDRMLKHALSSQDCSDKDADIERLKAEFQKAREWNQLTEIQVKLYRDIVEHQDSLLTRAADALSSYHGGPDFPKLIQELREAVK